MNTNALTAQNCSLFEIDAELEAAFDQLQEEREITGNISDEARDHCVQLFAELGKKIDRIAAYLRIQQHKANIAGEEAQRLQAAVTAWRYMSCMRASLRSSGPCKHWSNKSHDVRCSMQQPRKKYIW